MVLAAASGASWCGQAAPVAAKRLMAVLPVRPRGPARDAGVVLRGDLPRPRRVRRRSGAGPDAEEPVLRAHGDPHAVSAAHRGAAAPGTHRLRLGLRPRRARGLPARFGAQSACADGAERRDAAAVHATGHEAPGAHHQRARDRLRGVLRVRHVSAGAAPQFAAARQPRGAVHVGAAAGRRPRARPVAPARLHSPRRVRRVRRAVALRGAVVAVARGGLVRRPRRRPRRARRAAARRRGLRPR